MKRSIKPVYWHQGLFLQPHHFQYQEEFFQSRMELLRRQASPFFWGVHSMRLREEALENKVFELLEGCFVFQDGTMVTLPDNAVLQPRSFKDVESRILPGEPMRVFLGIRKIMPGEKNAVISNAHDNPAGVRAKYVSAPDPEMMENLYEGGEQANVHFLRYVLRIIWEPELESMGDYLCFPVASLENTGDSVKYSASFIPPVLGLESAPVLLELVRDIQDALFTRARLLEFYKISRQIRVEDIEGNYLRYIEALRAINRYVPKLQHATETPLVHPWALYGVLREMVGELSTFTERINALGKLADGTGLVPAYDHEQLEHCFGAVKLLIGELLGGIIIGADNVIELKRDESRFQAELPSEAFDKRSAVYLMIRASGERSQVVNVLEHHAKAGASNVIETLVSRAIEGVPLEYRETPPPGIPIYQNGYCFLIDRMHPAWEEVERKGTFCLYWDEAPEDAAAEMIIARR